MKIYNKMVKGLKKENCTKTYLLFRQYGAGTEVPIKSLLGHRSQAPPEVRHISGQHVKEFRDFLARYPEDFVVKEEIVYLREYEGKITTTFRESEEFKIDPIVTNQFLTFFRETVDQKVVTLHYITLGAVSLLYNQL